VKTIADIEVLLAVLLLESPAVLLVDTVQYLVVPDAQLLSPVLLQFASELGEFHVQQAYRQ